MKSATAASKAPDASNATNTIETTPANVLDVTKKAKKKAKEKKQPYDLHDTLSDKPISKPKPLLKKKQPTSVIAAAKFELVESDWVLRCSLLPIYMVLCSTISN